jgi:hypothetical protein
MAREKGLLSWRKNEARVLARIITESDAVMIFPAQDRVPGSIQSVYIALAIYGRRQPQWWLRWWRR